MADDDSNFWGDVGKAVVAIAVAETLSYGLSQLQGGDQKAPTAQSITSKVSSSPAYIMLGGYSKSAGLKVFDAVRGDVYGIIQAIHRGRINDYLWFYLNDDNVDIDGAGKVTAVYAGTELYGDGRYVDNPDQTVNIQYRTGAVPETAYTEFTSRWPTRWTSAHRGDGISSISMICYGKGKNQTQAYPAGIPNLSVVARPGDIYDWRDEDQDRADPTTWGPCDNPVINFVNLECFRWGRSWDRCIAPVLDALTAQADICDDLVALAAGGAEKRYTCAGWYIDTPDRNSIRTKLAATMDGWWSFDGRGRLVLKAGKYENPTFVLTTEYIEEGSTWSRGVTRDQRASGVTITYTDPNSSYNTNSPDAWVIADNGGQYTQLSLEWVTSWSQARRLAKRFASRINPAYTGQIRTGPNGFLGLGQRYIRLQNENEPSMADVVCEVTNAEFDPASGQFVFDVISADPNIDAWNPATEEGASPAIVEREAAEALTTPTIQFVTPYYDGGNIRLKITATGPDRGDLTWYARWRVTGQTAWNSGDGSLDDVAISGGQVYFNTGVVTSATSIDVQVEYFTGSDTPSGWSTTFTVNSSVVPPAWADAGALWQAEGTTTSNRFWTGNTSYASFAAAVTATKASLTRSTSKLAANAAGVYSSFSTNVIAMTDKGISNEPAETNLLTYSDTLSNALWIASAVTKTAGQTTPFGSDGALVTCNGASALHGLRRDNLSVVGTQSYALRYLVKAGTADRLQIAFGGAFSGTAYINFYLNGSGSISASGAGTTGTIVLENGWYVITATAVASSTSAAAQGYINAITTGSETRNPTLTLSTTFYVGRGEFIDGAASGTPIVTTTTSVTRNADVLKFYPVPGTYTVTVTYSDATTDVYTSQAITGSGWAVPTKLNRYITKIVGS